MTTWTLPESTYPLLFKGLESGFCVVEVDLEAVDDAGEVRIDYRVVEANSAFYKETGFPEAILGQWLRAAAPALEDAWYQIYGGVLKSGEPAHFEQGSEALGRWFNVHAFRLGTLENRLVAILFTDVTAKRKAHEQLRELNATLEQRIADASADLDRVWRNASDMFVVIDGAGVFQRVNPATHRILGWSDEELLGKAVFDFVHSDDLEPTLGALHHAQGDRLPTFENRYKTKDGGYKTISWVAAPEGELIFAYGRDVTEAKEQQEQLANAQEALRQSQKMEAVGQLTGGLAHDFNNIIAGISGSLDMMSTRLAQGRISELDRYITGAAGAAKRAAGLTQRLLAFSRRQTLDPKPTNLNTLVNGMLELVNRSMGPEIQVETAGAAGLWTTSVDAGQLENALLNLCINARDAMPDGGKLTIETSNRWMDDRIARQHAMHPGQYVSLCVSDTGTGMSPEIIERAFDPFFTTKPMGQGTGLGLSMVYGFAGQSGGAVRIYSEVGHGTMVCIYLPRHHDDDVPAEEMPLSGEQAPKAHGGETVLLIDDEPLVRMIAAEALEELGYNVIEAGDGATGTKILNSGRHIDLLITDVGLPGGMNGRQVADAARVARPDLKVLFITGYAENAVLNHGHLDQGMHVLTKPFQMDVFGSRVKDLITGEK